MWYFFLVLKDKNMQTETKKLCLKSKLKDKALSITSSVAIVTLSYKNLPQSLTYIPETPSKKKNTTNQFVSDSRK